MIETTWQYEVHAIRPRRLRPHDAPVARAFIQEYAGLIERIAFDVLLGPWREPIAPRPFSVRAAQALTRLRADALVLLRDGRAWAVEFKPHGDAKALGQAIAYAYWATRDDEERRTWRAVIVCHEVHPAVAAQLEDLGGLVVKVPWPEEG